MPPHLSGVPVRLLFCPIQHVPYPICAGHLCDESQDWQGSDDSKKEEARWQKLISIRRRLSQSLSKSLGMTAGVSHEEERRAATLEENAKGWQPPCQGLTLRGKMGNLKGRCQSRTVDEKKKQKTRPRNKGCLRPPPLSLLQDPLLPGAYKHFTLPLSTYFSQPTLYLSVPMSVFSSRVQTMSPFRSRIGLLQTLDE